MRSGLAVIALGVLLRDAGVTTLSASPGRARTTAQLPALTGNWLEPLELPDGEVAFVAPPIGAREPRPLIIAVHGAGDRPEWACGGWRIACESYAFVLCPRGARFDAQRFAWTSSAAIQRAIERALPALRARYGSYVFEGPPVYAGFSQGATLSAPVLLSDVSRFAAVIFAEGGYGTSADPAFARRFRAAGASEVLLACGTPGCFARAKAARRVLENAGLGVFVAGDARSGHNLNELMQRSLRATWPDFVRALPGWSEYPEHRW